VVGIVVDGVSVDGHRLATPVDENQVADVKMMLSLLTEAGGVVIKPAPVAITHTPDPIPVAAPVVTVPQARADGLTQFPDTGGIDGWTRL
jgi:two-component system, chemotaxis family, sensor kinase CheA